MFGRIKILIANSPIGKVFTAKRIAEETVDVDAIDVDEIDGNSKHNRDEFWAGFIKDMEQMSKIMEPKGKAGYQYRKRGKYDNSHKYF